MTLMRYVVAVIGLRCLTEGKFACDRHGRCPPRGIRSPDSAIGHAACILSVVPEDPAIPVV